GWMSSRVGFRGNEGTPAVSGAVNPFSDGAAERPGAVTDGSSRPPGDSSKSKETRAGRVNEDSNARGGRFPRENPVDSASGFVHVAADESVVSRDGKSVPVRSKGESMNGANFEVVCLTKSAGSRVVALDAAGLAADEEQPAVERRGQCRHRAKAC